MISHDPLAWLADCKRSIDDDIAAYAKQVRATTLQQYGRIVVEAETDVFLDMLTRGGKRIRGALVIAGYEMCGGQNRAMILQAARAIEMLHTYILMIDDIQDRSALRRGLPTAHELLTAYHRKHKLRGDAAHAGMSLALNAALAGAHAAQTILANMDADPQLRLNVLSIANRSMAVTAHGQTLDIMNELVDTPSEADVERVLEWKTALYTIVNPLHVGMVLAGADCHATDGITPYATHLGRAFQITDDILGVFGDEKELGKVPGDDIREGKGTLLIVYALKHISAEDRVYLQHCLGNQDLTPQDFERCKKIIAASGAVAHAKAVAAEQLAASLVALDKTTGSWDEQGTIFLRELAKMLLSRTA